MTRRHVAVLFEFPTVNGGEESILAILNRLVGENLDFTAIAPANGQLADRLNEAAVPLVPFAVRGDNGTKRETGVLQTELSGIVDDLKPHVLHANSLTMSRLIGQMGPFGDSNRRRTGHLRDIMKLSRTAVADINSNDALIAVSEATRDFHVSQGLTADKCRVIHNGIDTERFRRTPARREQLRRTLFPQISPSSLVLLNVGQICLRKGQLNLAKAVCRLPDMGADVHLVLAGERHSIKQESRDYEQAIRNEFTASGSPERLHTIGYRNDIIDLMNSADALVHASHQEPFGRTLLEAASCELPIVATNVGGTSEMLRPDQDAVLVEPGDVAGLSEAIRALLKTPEAANLRSKSARARILQLFTVDRAATQTAEVWTNHPDVTLRAE